MFTTLSALPGAQVPSLRGRPRAIRSVVLPCILFFFAVLPSAAHALAFTSPTPNEVVTGPVLKITGTAGVSAAGYSSVSFSVGNTATSTSIDEENITPQPDGTFTVTLPAPADGPYQAAVFQLFFNPVDFSTTILTSRLDFSVDNNAPVVDISSPTDGQHVNAITVTGTAGTALGDAGTVAVAIHDGTVSSPGPGLVAQSYPSVAVGAGGSYSQSAASGTTPDGQYFVTVTQKDSAGHQTSVSRNLVLDGTSPTLSVSSPADGARVKSFSITGHGGTATGDATKVRYEVFAGTAPTPAASKASGQLTLGAGGAFTAVPSLLDGTYLVRVTQSDDAGNVATVDRLVTVDNAAPALTLDTPADGARVERLSVSGTGGTATGDTRTVTFQIYAGKTVSGNPIQTTPPLALQNDGSFSEVLPSGADGDYVVRATQSDDLGNTATVDHVFTTDGTAPVLSVDTPAASARVKTATVSGTGGIATGDANAVAVKIYAGSTVSGSAVASGNPAVGAGGAYSFSPSTALTDGNYIARVSQSDDVGNIATVDRKFIVDATGPELSIDTPASGERIQALSLAGTGGVATGDDTSVSYGVYAGTTATGNAVKSGTAQLSNTGQYLQSVPGLADGTYTARVTQSDDRGNATDVDRTFTVDSTGPALTLSSPADGARVKSLTVSGVAGTAAGDSSTLDINVYAGGTVSGSPVANVEQPSDTGGAFSWSPAPALTDGDYIVRVRQFDIAGAFGNVTTIDRKFTVDLTPPVVTLTAPAAGSSVQAADVHLSGTGSKADGDQPNVTVKLFSGGSASGNPVATLNASVGSGGAFSVSPNPPLSAGGYTAVASQADTAGNVSAPATATFTVAVPPTPAPTPTPALKPQSAVAGLLASMVATGKTGDAVKTYGLDCLQRMATTIRTLTPVAANVSATATSTKNGKTIGLTATQVGKGRSVVTICLNAAGRKLIKRDRKGNPKPIPATVAVLATAPGYAPASATINARFTHRFPVHFH